MLGSLANQDFVILFVHIDEACCGDFVFHPATDVEWCTGVLGVLIKSIAEVPKEFVLGHGAVVVFDVVFDIRFAQFIVLTRGSFLG